MSSRPAAILAEAGTNESRVESADEPASISPAFLESHRQENLSTPSELEELLGEVPGQRYDISSYSRYNMKLPRLSGGFRFRESPPPGKALRIAIVQTDNFELAMRSGTSGYVLKYLPAFHDAWALYEAVHEKDQFRLEPTALLATDSGRYRRSGHGSVVLHFRPGRLVVTRGKNVLLEAPVDGDPRDWILEIATTALFREIRWIDDFDVPEVSDSFIQVSTTSGNEAVQPSDWTWTVTPDVAAKVERMADGAVRLVVDGQSGVVQAMTSLPVNEVFAYTFEIESPTPKTGIALLDVEGRAIAALGFFRHNETRGTVFAPDKPASADDRRSFDRRNRIAPLIASRQWYRMIVAGGSVNWEFSRDGRAWSRVQPGGEPCEGKPVAVALYASPGKEHREITLCRLRFETLRETSRLAARVPRDVISDELIADDRVRPWNEARDMARPEGIPVRDWLYACNVRRLLENRSWFASRRVLFDLIDTVRHDDSLSWNERSQVLAELARILPAYDWGTWHEFSESIEPTFLDWARQGLSQPYQKAARFVDSSMYWTEWDRTAYLPAALRHEIFESMASGDSFALGELCAAAMCRCPVNEMEHLLPGPREMLRAAAARAAASWERLKYLPVDSRPSRMPPSRLEVTKEAFNLTTEINAGLREGGNAAVHALVENRYGAGVGCLPAPKDPAHWLSFDEWVRRLIHAEPALGQRIREEYSAALQLRTQECIKSGDETTAVEIARQTYLGKPAAAAALWLGDRRLVLGKAAEAASWYATAVQAGDEETQAALSQRRALLARLGNSTDATQQATWDETGFRGNCGLERRVAPAADRTGVPSEADEDSLPWLPAQYSLEAVFKMHGIHVKKPRAMPSRDFNWAGKQTTAVFEQDVVWLTNQVELSAVERNSRLSLWSHWCSVDEAGQQWPLVWMKPVRLDGRIYCRQLTASGPRIVCVDAVDGRMLWTSRADSYAASDPWCIGRELFCVFGQPAGNDLRLSIVEMDSSTGDVLRRVPLLSYRDVWNRKLTARVCRTDDRLIVTAGDTAIGCDISGNVLWIRRIPWIWGEWNDWWNGNDWLRREEENPLPVGRYVVFTTRGSWCITCVDPKDGTLVWQRAEGRLLSIVGKVGGNVIVHASDGFFIVSADDGKVVTAVSCERVEDAAITPDGRFMLVVQLQPKSQNKTDVVLRWYRLPSLEPAGETVLQEFSGDVFVGPLAFAADATHLLTARASNAAEGTWYRLVPQGPLEETSADGP
ncbi:outer membrane protein assembly factor BamB family protein [Thermostilla marina]